MLTHPLHLLFHSFTPHFIHFFTSMFYPSLSTHSVTVAEVFVDPPKTYLLLQFTTLRVVKKGYVACSGQKGIRESHMILFQAETFKSQCVIFTSLTPCDGNHGDLTSKYCTSRWWLLHQSGSFGDYTGQSIPPSPLNHPGHIM